MSQDSMNVELQKVRTSLSAIEELINSFGSKNIDPENILMKDSCVFATKTIQVKEVRSFQNEIELLPKNEDDVMHYGLCIIPQPNGITLLLGNKVLNYQIDNTDVLLFFKKSIMALAMKGGDLDGVQR